MDLAPDCYGGFFRALTRDSRPALASLAPFERQLNFSERSEEKKKSYRRKVSNLSKIFLYSECIFSHIYVNWLEFYLLFN